MSDRSIPEPSEDDFSVALTGLHTQAKRWGLETNDLCVSGFLNHTAEVHAQMAAEIRWLHSLVQTEIK